MTSQKRPYTFRVAGFYVITIAIGITISLLAGELLVRVFSPQPYMYPRFKYSEEYESVLFENTTMVDALPGTYEFHYTTNCYGYRGRAVPIADKYDRPNILILGDSNAFGKGVNDGEEFPAVMQTILGPDLTVINLSVIGFCLTQQIRTFYEFGSKYQPRIVILQFCKNDPTDNLESRVAEVREGQFVFHNTSKHTGKRIRTIHLPSFVEESQLFNFMRLRVIFPIVDYLHRRSAEGSALNSTNQGSTAGNATVSQAEKFYNELLEPFARDLKKRGIVFLMISVNHELAEFPGIVRKVHDLQNEGTLRYIEVEPWFAGTGDFGSPEGHAWGSIGHRIIGEHMAEIVASLSHP